MQGYGGSQCATYAACTHVLKMSLPAEKQMRSYPDEGLQNEREGVKWTLLPFEFSVYRQSLSGHGVSRGVILQVRMPIADR